MSNPPNPSFGVVYPLWNHTREPGNLLDRLVGEVGIDHITIPVVTGPVEQFRPFFFPETPYFGSEGGWHYPPGPTITATGIKPHVAAWCGKRDILRQVCDDAQRAGLRVCLELGFAQIPGLCSDTPHVAAMSAWGQVMLDPAPCFSNPTLRQWVEATLADLARYEPAGVQISCLDLDLENGGAGVSFSMTGDASSICFCSACRQIALSAGISVDASAAAARELLLRRRTGTTEPHDPETVLTHDHLLRQYVAAREAAFTHWITDIARYVSGYRFLFDDARGLHAPPPWTRIARWIAVEMNEEALGGLRPCAARSLSVVPRGNRSATNLVVAVQRAIDTGTWFFDFDDLDTNPLEALTWLKQAIRYARRA